MSPQPGGAHALLHASAFSSLPSSQFSPGPTSPSPQVCSVQFSLHRPVSLLASPSSHSSMPTCINPSPHSAALQSVTHSSV
jgi:hypothetical protein